ncbi:HEPN domain-containing protein [Methanocella sp. MCL-LM]|uniref:HEPN domain-containing protein n=1 Tax=Methanocella sp. MCL-LM TaxID=3412035 RepID=UPI003C75E226
MKLDDCFQKRLLIRTHPDIENAKRSLTLARENLTGAQKNVDIGLYRMAIVFSYTAMFHAARAILYVDGVKERSHECIPLYLREKHPSLKRYAVVLDSYRKNRHDAIYSLEYEAGKQDAITAVMLGNDLLAAIEKVLEAQ